jgi:hypothetical protein
MFTLFLYVVSMTVLINLTIAAGIFGVGFFVVGAIRRSDVAVRIGLSCFLAFTLGLWAVCIILPLT